MSATRCKTMLRTFTRLCLTLVMANSQTPERGKKMTYKVTEVQSKDKTREYWISGPSLESVESFWAWLVDNGTIQSYTITREAV